MDQLKIFIELSRLNKPIGILLLFWPCSWGLALAYNSMQDLEKLIYFLILFFLGSVLMRSAGCIVNDIVDRNIDRKVQRTKNRPLASGAITVKKSLLYVVALCLVAFFILIQFNNLTIVLGMCSMILAFSYPFMKRITYWPQLFLGLTFNWGIVMAWTAMNNTISTEILLLYMSAIFWTLGYDTIYGLQDIVDDEIIGMKSTSIKFKNNPKFFVAMCYLINLSLILYLFKDFLGINFFVFFITIYVITLIVQIFHFDKNVPKKCLQAFKLNNFSGLILLTSIFFLK